MDGYTSWIEDDYPDTFSEFIFPILQLLCVMISHWLIVLKHKMPIQILHKSRWIGLVSVVHLWGVVRTGIPISGGYVKIVEL